jgi:hypothetical protein
MLQTRPRETETDLETEIAHALTLRDADRDWQAARARLAELKRQLAAVAPMDPLMIRAQDDAHDRRVTLQREIDRQTLAVQELDARLSAEVCAALRPLHRRLVQKLGLALREVGAANDELAALSETLGRHAVVGATTHLRPMSFEPAGRLSDAYSGVNVWRRDAESHGLPTD